MWGRQPVLIALFALLTLHCAGAARGDDDPKPANPDPGFLEFLGSVDRLADVNPDYLSQADPTKGPGGKSAPPPAPTPAPAPPPPPPPAPQPLRPSASASSGVPHNE